MSARRAVTSQESDESLVARCQAGDLSAFPILVERYKDPIYNLAYRMLRQREEAEDAAQEAFLHVFRSLGRFSTDQRFSPWIYKIASNLCLDRLRKRRGVVLSLDAPVSAESDVARELPDWRDNPERAAENTELKSTVQAAVEGLPERYRMIVILRHMHDLSYEEIAEATGLPLGTVKTRLFRARELLRHVLSAPVEP